MQPLVDRAAAVLRRQSVPVLPLRELARLVGQSGMAVSETVLLRAMAAEPERFRTVQPWRALPGVEPDPRARARLQAPARPSARPSPARARAPQPSPFPGRSAGEGEIWVLPGAPPERGDPPGVERAALRRLRATLVGLGWALDATSARDLARWAGMVLEGERFRGTLPLDQRAHVSEG